MRIYTRLGCLQQQTIALFFWQLGFWTAGWKVTPPLWTESPEPLGFMGMCGLPLLLWFMVSLFRYVVDDTLG